MLWLTMREVTKYTMKIWRNSDLTSAAFVVFQKGQELIPRLI